MQLQDRKLSLNFEGEDIRQLHGELKQLGFELSDAEIDKALFGPTTEEAVKHLQKTHGLQPTGIVDERTAALITREGERSRPSNARPFVVKGRVYANGQPVAQVPVRAFDQDLRHEQPLGTETWTRKDGSFEIPYGRAEFCRAEKGGADLIIRAFDLKGAKTIASTEVIYNAPQEVTVKLVVDTEEKGPSEYEQLLKDVEPLLLHVKVKGARRPTTLRKLADLKEDQQQREISFLTRELGRERQIATFLVLAARLGIETKLPAEVFYGLFRLGESTHLPTLVGQKLTQIRSTLKAAADRNIIPEFHDEQALNHIVDDFKELRVRRTLDEPVQPGKSSLGALLETALPQNRKKQAAFLARYLEHQDRDEPEPIEHFWQALREDEEFKDDIDVLQFTLQAGTLTQNHLPLVNELQQLRREDKLQTPRDWAKLDAEELGKLIQKQGSDGRPIGFPPDVPGKGDTEKARNYVTMMARFIEDAFPTPVIAHQVEKEARPELADVVQFFNNNQSFEFRNISVDAYLAQHGPSALRGLEEPEASAQTLKGMQRLFKVTPRYPELRVLREGGLASAHDIAALGKKTFLQQFQDSLGGTEKALGIYNRASQTEAMAMALYSGYSDSLNRGMAAAIGWSGPQADEALEEEMNELGMAVPTWKKLFGSLDLCDCEHCRSVYSPAAYLIDILEFLKRRPEITAGRHPLVALNARRPDLGTLDLSCENTNTVLPYVDLVNEVLEYIVEPLPAFFPFGISADLKGDLDGRYLSPDLQTAFRPALSASAGIVVLNQGREWRILDTSYAYSLLDRDPTNDTIQVVGHGWQTYTSSEELKANPQYTNPEAYERLAEAVYPWDLPFDRWIVEARTYLQHLDVNRHDLMAAFQSRGEPPAPDDNAIAAEYVGLTPAEWRILTGTYPTESFQALTREYWGYPRIPVPLGWTDHLSQVSRFLQTSELTYQELLDLLATRLVNPDGALFISSADPDDLSTCDLTQLHIVNLDADALDRIHRFVRLWRRLGWSMSELDKAIETLKPANREVSDLNAAEWADLLRRLSHVQRLKDRLRVPVVEMLSWWSPIDTAQYSPPGKAPSPSLFDDIFQNKAIFTSADELTTYSLNELRDQLQEHEQSLSLVISSVRVALRATAADLSDVSSDLSGRVEDEGTADHLNLENLSYLFRVVSICRALKLTVQDFLTLRILAEAKPLLDPIRIVATTPDDERVYPEDTLGWIEILDKIRSSSFSNADLSYLMRSSDSETKDSGPAESAIALVLSELRTGLQAIASEQFLSPDANGDLTRAKLLLLNWDRTSVEDVISVLNNSKVFSVPVTVTPTIELPLPLEDIPDVLETEEQKAALSRKLILSMSDSTALLQFEGAMSTNERTALLSLSDDEDYQQAIDGIDGIGGLFNAPREFIATRMKAFDPMVSAPLAVLPRRVAFPEELQHRISYDTQALELRYVGVMTESDQTSLLDLSSDGGYQSAIEGLFAASNEPIDSEDENAFLTSADVAALFDAPLDEVGIPERFGYVLEKLLPDLRIALSRDLVKKLLGDALNLEPTTTNRLLTRWVQAATDPEQKAMADFVAKDFQASQSAVTASAFPEQFLTLRRLHKISHAIDKMGVSADAVAWISDNGPGIGWPDLAVLPVQDGEADSPFSNWVRLLDGLQVFKQLPSRDMTLFDLFGLIGDFAEIDGAAKQTYLGALAESTDWDLADLEVLAGQRDSLTDKGLLDLTFPDDFQTEKALSVLIPCFKLLTSLGVSASDATAWAQADIAFSDAQAIQHAVKAQYDNYQWLELAGPLRDTLRETQRASLVSYLVHRADLWLTADQIDALEAAGRRPDANRLYEHLLLDVEMSPCMMTSRIKQASASVQLFVQRCLMGLEEGISLTEEAEEQWKWMKNYRVWEANRKVFLYPENWIEPELRDDKTPFFRDLENELMQNEVNQDTVEAAFSRYLEKLDAVARLEVCGMYHEIGAGRNILHVFGRTEGDPHVYYYRRAVDFAYWTAWEEVTADIEGNHLIPVVHEGRLKLFWPIFTEQQEEQHDPDLPAGRKYWEIQLAWSEYKNGAWSPKKVSSEEQLLTEKDLTVHLTKDEYTFKALQWGSNLAILCLNRTEGEGMETFTYVGVFAFSGCREGILFQGILETSDDHVTVESGVVEKQIPYPLINRDTAPGYEFIARVHRELSPDRAFPKYMGFVETENTAGSLKLTGDYFPETKIATLNKTPGIFDLVYQHQLHWSQFQLLRWLAGNPSGIDFLRFLLLFPQFQYLRIPSFFFYQDDFRTFFVTPLTALRASHAFGNDVVSLELLFGSPRDFGDQAIPDSQAGNDMFGGDDGLAVDTISDTFSFSLCGDYCVSRYLFTTFYHPYLCHFIETFNRHGVEGLIKRDLQLVSDDFFEAEYEPEENVVIRGNRVEVETLQDPKEIWSLYPRDEVDFEYYGSYSQYNWELFFHVPLLIAERLSSNQRFAEAQQWYHLIFDPTDTSDDTVPRRYWRTRPFYEATQEKYESEQIRTFLRALADESTGPHIRARLERQVEQWRKNPFNPHLIARLRTTAFQKTVVQKYVDNLIAWGDYLFRQHTIENINEATQLYVLAAEILGPRPQKIAARSTPATKTVADMVTSSELDKFSNLLEEALPPGYSPSAGADAEGSVPISLGSVLYFCVPKNDKFAECWDRVEDRLFKIRHCMNIEGVVRELPLFQPPIEPGLLVKAVASGVDISSVVSDLNSPLPHYRFRVMVQKALELCNDAKALGAALLSALEKRDAEGLALLRSGHELTLLNGVTEVKKQQVAEAEEALENVNQSRELVKARKSYYTSLLTNSPTLTASVDTGSGVATLTVKPLYPANEYELAHLGLAGTGLLMQGGQAAMDLLAAILYLIPDTKAGAPTTIGTTIGGSNIGQSVQTFGKVLADTAAILNAGASLAATMGGYKRRAEEWAFQKELAAKELEQFQLPGGQEGPQVLMAQARLAIAEKDLDNHNLQVKNTEAVDAYMRDKFTNQELYGWMATQISTLYFQTYNLAYDIAKRAERAFRYELGLDESSFIQFGYWDSLKKGLLAGERLHHDLRRLEAAYLSQNEQEYEISKFISLSQLDPVALIKLKETGECFFSIPEAVFDLDFPGHYMRRIKSISLTVPCVSGPYSSVSVTLTLQSNRIRKKAIVGSSDYAWSGDINDDRFNYDAGGIQSIATSGAQNDSGLFELNFHNERYLPFEGEGAISTWRIQLPKELRQFDYQTISDVIMHMRYTAREGGEVLRKDATDDLLDHFEGIPLVRAFSAKREFPTEWHHFLHRDEEADFHTLALALEKERFPFVARGRTLEIESMGVLLQLNEEWKAAHPDDDCYADGDPVSFVLKSSAGTRPYSWPPDPELKLRGSPIRNMPFSAVFEGQNESPGSWSLEIPGCDIEDDESELRRSIPENLRQPADSLSLNPDALDDLIILCHYCILRD